MKSRLIVTLMAACALALMVGCSGADAPEKVVERCWEHLAEGEYAKAVALMNVSAEQVQLYQSIYAEQSGELQRAGGVKNFELLGSSVGAEEATIEAAVVLADGQRIEATYKLVLTDEGWRITE
ncbi:MAG: DUF4878 domain-containing protein [Tidjanibacter sp.]|nr:DUF4878 domain-containing protein [Tidjanibacter sp.]